MAQFFGTSLWFAGNAVIDQLISKFDTNTHLLSFLISAVQLGFIIGTITFTIFTIADRYSASKVFLGCSLFGGLSTLLLLIPDISITNIVLARFCTGFFLAGIYPVGMKIAADHFKKGLGKALGFLVGALVLGTAFPHFITYISWKNAFSHVIIGTALLATLGGLSVWFFVPNGPYKHKINKIPKNALGILFKNKRFKKVAFGYFGHMWELYTFWIFVPLLLITYTRINEIQINIPLWSFIIIGIGSIACVLGGYCSQYIGSKKVAQYTLSLSGLCCVCSPLFFDTSIGIFLGFLCVWSLFVIADSPQFSTLVAHAAPPELKGTGLTLANCIGYCITIVSIQLMSLLTTYFAPSLYLPFLAIGPLFGLYHLRNA